MAITTAQQGVITEAEFVKIAILTSNGALVPARPVADDERRDFEIHLRRHFRETIAIQVKPARRLRMHAKSRRLQIDFDVKLPLVVDPRLWFLIARFDIPAMCLDDPLFLIPSSFFIRHAGHGFRDGTARFQFQASMELTANDIWMPHHVLKADLGNRLVQILNDLSTLRPDRQPAAGLLHLPNLIWVPSRAAAFTSSRRHPA